MDNNGWTPRYFDQGNKPPTPRNKRNSLLDHEDQRVRNIGAFVNAAPPVDRGELAYMALLMGLAIGVNDVDEARELIHLMLTETRDKSISVPESVRMLFEMADDLINSEVIL